MDRGSLILAFLPGAIGKVRPVIVVQTNAYSNTSALVVLPLTSDLDGIRGPRIDVASSAENGLRSTSRVMVDKIGIVRRIKVGQTIGRLGRDDMARVDQALTLFLGIGDR